MKGKRPTLRGFSADNDTAREATSEFRIVLYESRRLNELFHADPRFPAQMTFVQFKGRLEKIYREDGKGAYVKDWEGKTHSFLLKDRRRALEFAVRLLGNRPINLTTPLKKAVQRTTLTSRDARPLDPKKAKRAYARRDKYVAELEGLERGDGSPAGGLRSPNERRKRIEELKTLLARLPT